MISQPKINAIFRRFLKIIKLLTLILWNFGFFVFLIDQTSFLVTNQKSNFELWQILTILIIHGGLTYFILYKFGWDNLFKLIYIKLYLNEKSIKQKFSNLFYSSVIKNEKNVNIKTKVSKKYLILKTISLSLKFIYLFSVFLFCLFYFYSVFYDYRFEPFVKVLTYLATIFMFFVIYKLIFEFKRTLKWIFKKINNLEKEKNFDNSTILESKFAKICRILSLLWNLAFLIASFYIYNFTDCGYQTIITNCTNHFSSFLSLMLYYLLLESLLNLIWIVALMINRKSIISKRILNFKIVILALLVFGLYSIFTIGNGFIMYIVFLMIFIFNLYMLFLFIRDFLKLMNQLLGNKNI